LLLLKTNQLTRLLILLCPVEIAHLELKQSEQVLNPRVLVILLVGLQLDEVSFTLVILAQVFEAVGPLGETLFPLLFLFLVLE